MKKHHHLLLFLPFLLQLFLDCNMKRLEALDANTDIEALLSFKLVVSDPQNALIGWNSSSSHCSWFGVSCTANETRVQSLRLAGLGLFGIIPHQLSNLTFLQILDLSNNHFYGQIPLEFNQLSLLQHFILGRNSINGTIPVGLSQCYNLERIGLEFNQLTGNLPFELGHLPRLKTLDVSVNNLTGPIPPTFGNLSSLTTLRLSRNQFFGEIPYELGRLRNLLILQLSQNQFSGEIPHSIYNISSLVFISATQNKLIGKLPTDMGLALPNLKQLFLAQNRLEGPIPTSLSNASQIQILDFSSNGFRGSIPLLGNMNNLIKLYLGLNNFSSTTELNSQVIASLTNCTQLEVLTLNSNQLAGELPSSVANLSRHLQEFCVDGNSLTGSFPQGFEKFQNLTVLSLHQNSFIGEIPNSIGMLHKLQKFSVNQNKFSGEIPDIFGNLTQLYLIAMGNNQFSGRIPISIATCQHLDILGLVRNRLNGSIPKEIFSLPDLTVLLLAKNELSGSVPFEVDSLKQLAFIDVSNNQLSGNIPTTIGGCWSLQYLSMAGNKITGFIPKSSGLLSALESLDLSNNNLSGPIPEDLESLRVLQNLNLSFNNLEGQVPSKGVFVNLSWDSLQGNKLCGGDQEAAERLRVPACTTKKKPNKTVSLKIIIPIASFTALMCVMFCFLCALISQKKRKRYKGIFSSIKWSPLKISYTEIRLATDGFAAENLIGKGGFGSVYKGVIGSSGVSTIVAIKVLDLEQRKASQSFNAECETLRNVRHRNLVKVITSCSSIDHEGAEFKALVMEFMSNGNLDKWLYPEYATYGSSLTLIQRLNIAIDIASAMDYLHHDCEPPVVHCDLKPGNILLDENMGACIGDFGLARFLSPNPSQSESYTIGLKGSIGYIPPEYGWGAKVSTSGDVYSYGILLLEIFTAKKPTDEMFKEGLDLNTFASAVHENQVWVIADPRLIEENHYSEHSTTTSHSSVHTNSSGSNSSSNATSNWRITREECLAAVIKVGLSCAAHSANDRLTMRETLTKLHAIKASLQQV